MAKFKTELHCHTSEVSRCASENAEDTVEKYLKYGYKTIVLTNHLSRGTFNTDELRDAPWEKKAEYFINGYYKMKEAAGDRMNILFGAEINFPQNNNDYLLFGMTPEFLMEHPDMHMMDLAAFYNEINHPNRFIIIHAHPMRWNCQIMYPWFVDGWEIYNGHPENESHNKVSKAYSEYYPNKIMTSGSDHHDPAHFPAGGIETDFEIKTMDELMATFRSKEYTIIEEEEIRLGTKRL